MSSGLKTKNQRYQIFVIMAIETKCQTLVRKKTATK